MMRGDFTKKQTMKFHQLLIIVIEIKPKKFPVNSHRGQNTVVSYIKTEQTKQRLLLIITASKKQEPFFLCLHHITSYHELFSSDPWLFSSCLLLPFLIFALTFDFVTSVCTVFAKFPTAIIMNRIPHVIT